MQKAIAIDGPSGAGKSTVARLVAQNLGFRYIDTGAMYRACTLHALRNNLDVYDEAAVSADTESLDLRLEAGNGLPFIFMNGENVSDAIRGKEVTANVSVVCSYRRVREAMVSQQRKFAEEGGVIMDGRDIGTYVLPGAALKIYLTADPRERGHRRYLEWQEKGIGKDMSEEDIVEDIIRRDTLDSTREINPLRQAEDAVLLDTTGMSVDEVVRAIEALWKEKGTDAV